MSIKENIRFADSKYMDKQVEDITKVCGIYDDIVNMTDGFDTIIGCLLYTSQKKKQKIFL